MLGKKYGSLIHEFSRDLLDLIGMSRTTSWKFSSYLFSRTISILTSMHFLVFWQFSNNNRLVWLPVSSVALGLVNSFYHTGGGEASINEHLKLGLNHVSWTINISLLVTSTYRTHNSFPMCQPCTGHRTNRPTGSGTNFCLCQRPYKVGMIKFDWFTKLDICIREDFHL